MKRLSILVLIFVNLNSRPDLDLRDFYNNAKAKYDSKLESKEKELEDIKKEIKKNNIKKILFLSDIEVSELIKNVENLIEKDDKKDFDKIKDFLYLFNKDLLATLASSEFINKMEKLYDESYSSQEIEHILRSMKSKNKAKSIFNEPRLLAQELHLIKNILFPLINKYFKNYCNFK